MFLGVSHNRRRPVGPISTVGYRTRVGLGLLGVVSARVRRASAAREKRFSAARDTAGILRTSLSLQVHRVMSREPAGRQKESPTLGVNTPIGSLTEVAANVRLTVTLPHEGRSAPSVGALKGPVVQMSGAVVHANSKFSLIGGAAAFYSALETAFKKPRDPHPLGNSRRGNTSHVREHTCITFDARTLCRRLLEAFDLDRCEVGSFRALALRR